MGTLSKSKFVHLITIFGFFACKDENMKDGAEQRNEKLIKLCRKFAKRADALEKRAFENGEYRLKGFFPDFNRLFDTYAHGTENRTLSDFNFRNPPRYAMLDSSVKVTVESVTENRYQITFEGAQKWNSMRFLADRIESHWKLIYVETYVGIANHGDKKGEEVWRKQKL